MCQLCKKECFTDGVRACRKFGCSNCPLCTDEDLQATWAELNSLSQAKLNRLQELLKKVPLKDVQDQLKKVQRKLQDQLKKVQRKLKQLKAQDYDHSDVFGPVSGLFTEHEYDFGPGDYA